MTGQTEILLVDNDEDLLEAVQVRLLAEGFSVTTACDARQAISLFPSRRFDLVITDVCMPGLDGIGLAEDLRRLSTIPILLMTGYPASYVDAFGHLPGVRLIPKPFAWTTIIEILAEELPDGAVPETPRLIYLDRPA